MSRFLQGQKLFTSQIQLQGYLLTIAALLKTQIGTNQTTSTMVELMVFLCITVAEDFQLFSLSSLLECYLLPWLIIPIVFKPYKDSGC